MLIMSTVPPGKIKSTTSRAPQFHRSMHQIHHRTPRNRWTPLSRSLTKPTPNSIESTVYRKPTHTDRYLDYNSNHPISAKLSAIHTLIPRAKQVCSIPVFLVKEMDHCHKVLQDKHYPTQFFQQGKLNRKPTKSQTHPQ